MGQLDDAVLKADQTRAVLVAAGAVDAFGGLFAAQFPSATAQVFADARTMAVAGDAVYASLATAGVALLAPHIFPATPELYAQYENVGVVRDVLARSEAVGVAVGSGTLNDLVKRASGELGRPYAVMGTAASMDGYTAFGASISKDGYKQTLDCPAPVLAAADLDVLAAAPPVMGASGYGDLIGKVVAGADWILSDELGIEAVDPVVWDLVQPKLRESVGDPAGVAAGDVTAVGRLAEGLFMSGLAMQAYHGSRPASGAEHLFSHLWEMEGLGVDLVPRRLSHGFKVGLGTIANAALYELVLDLDLGDLDAAGAAAAWPSWEEREADIRSRFGLPGLTAAAVAQSRAKYADAAGVKERLTLVRAKWPALRSRLAAQLLPAQEIQDKLRAVGAP